MKKTCTTPLGPAFRVSAPLSNMKVFHPCLSIGMVAWGVCDLLNPQGLKRGRIGVVMSLELANWIRSYNKCRQLKEKNCRKNK